MTPVEILTEIAKLTAGSREERRVRPDRREGPVEDRLRHDFEVLMIRSIPAEARDQPVNRGASKDFWRQELGAPAKKYKFQDRKTHADIPPHVALESALNAVFADTESAGNLRAENIGPRVADQMVKRFDVQCIDRRATPDSPLLRFLRNQRVQACIDMVLLTAFTATASVAVTPDGAQTVWDLAMRAGIGSWIDLLGVRFAAVFVGTLITGLFLLRRR